MSESCKRGSPNSVLLAEAMATIDAAFSAASAALDPGITADHAAHLRRVGCGQLAVAARLLIAARPATKLPVSGAAAGQSS